MTKILDIIDIRPNRAQRRAKRVVLHSIKPAKAAPDVINSETSTPTSQAQAQDYLAQAMLLNWFGQSPVQFHRMFVDITGDVLSALWLSYVMDKKSTMDSPDETVDMNFQEFERETGLTRSQQIACRRVLVKKGLLTQEGRGRATRYRIHQDQIQHLLREHSVPMAVLLRDSDQLLANSGLPPGVRVRRQRSA